MKGGIVVVLLLARRAHALDNGLGATPVMAWSSWNYFATDINEEIVLDTADALVSTGLAKLGYVYVNIDAGSMHTQRDPATHKILPDKNKFPNGMRFIADKLHAKGLKLGVYTDLSDHSCGTGPGSLGHYEQDANTFANEWQADYLKVDFCGPDLSMLPGMKPFPPLEQSCSAGALTAGGDLRRANTTIAAALNWCSSNSSCAGFTTKTAATPGVCNSTAVLDMYFKTGDARPNGDPVWSHWMKPGAGLVPVEASAQYTHWLALGTALNKTGRPVYYSICPHTLSSKVGTAAPFDLLYAPPPAWTAQQRRDVANSVLVEYTNTADTWLDEAKRIGILTDIDAMLAATSLNYSVPGSWNDADMLQLCTYGKGQTPGDGMALNEYRVHYTVWSILASPLILGADLRSVKDQHPDCFALMANADIVAVNQDPAALPPRLVYQQPPISAPNLTSATIQQQVFARDLSRRTEGTSRVAVLLLNRGGSNTRMNVTWSQLGVGLPAGAGEVLVYDVVAQSSLPSQQTHTAVAHAAIVPSHDVSFVILTYRRYIE